MVKKINNKKPKELAKKKAKKAVKPAKKKAEIKKAVGLDLAKKRR